MLPGDYRDWPRTEQEKIEGIENIRNINWDNQETPKPKVLHHEYEEWIRASTEGNPDPNRDS